MPIYEYRCEECQQVFEQWKKRVEETSVTTPCPVCNGSSKRIISQTAFALKGEGWYVTEYGSRKADKAGATPTAAAEPSTKEAPVPTAPQCSGATCTAPAVSS